MVVGGKEPDADDDWIADNARATDVIITADVPLASRCIKAGARVLGTNGEAFSEDSIGHALAIRDLKSDLREAGVSTRGPRPISARERSRFSSKLDSLVQQAMRSS